MVERAGMITNRIKEYRARFDLKKEELGGLTYDPD